MTISIWIILILIVAVAFWFFYKKNKFKLKKPVVKAEKKESKYTLSNVDRMLDNVTQKEEQKEDVQDFSNKQDDVLNEAEKEILDDTPKEPKKKEIDFKSGIITSILLKKKDDL